MKKQKRYFNMVEVALALLVISLGLSTVLTLFPAGLKATAQAENDNNVVEAAECIYAYLQSLAFSSLPNAGSRPSATSTITKTSTDRIEDLGSGCYVYRKIFNGKNGDIQEFSCAAYVLTPQEGTECTSPSSYSFLLPRVSKPSPGETKSIVIKGRDGEDYYFTPFSCDNLPFDVKILDVELSYPATVAYEHREKRIFRMAFMDTDYKPYDSFVGGGGAEE